MVNNNLISKDTDIKTYLSEYLGIETEDLANDDSLKEDLHMNSLEISDFLHLLKEKGIDLDFSKINEVQTIQDIVDISFENEEL